MLFLLCVIININTLFCLEASVTVKVKGSSFIGKRMLSIFNDKPYVAFFNIPYAETPVGGLRFKSPIATKWSNKTYDFSHFPKKICTCCYDEDCLYLSINTPYFTDHTWNLPVIVWLDDNVEEYSPDFLIEEDVIVVTVKYRKSIFGFLNTEDEFAEGNMGAKDILMALEWVKTYIASFDGDPNRVTVAGVRNAATIVASMLLSPTAQGLFKRAIIISGSALSPADYRNYNFDIVNKLYWKLNGPYEKLNRTHLYEILSNHSTREIVLATQGIFDSTEVRDSQRLITAFGLSIENSKHAFINKFPADVYKTRITNDVDILIGYTSLESLYQLKGFARDRNLLKHLNYNFQYLVPFEGTHDVYGSRRYTKIRHKIMEFYFVNGTIGERSLRRYAKYVSDQVIYPLLRQARLQAEFTSANVYLYRFSFRGSLNVAWQTTVQNLNWSAATAGDEICYLFKCKSVNDVYNSAEVSDERHFIKKIARLLANFGKCGNPTPESNDNILGNLKWDPINGKSIRLMSLNRQFKMMNAPEVRRLKFWDDLKSEYFSDSHYKDEL